MRLDSLLYPSLLQMWVHSTICSEHDLTSTPIAQKYMDMVRIEASYRPAFWQKHIDKLEDA